MAQDVLTGVDLAQDVFQVRCALVTGHVRFRRKLSRPRFCRFMADHPAAVAVMEARGSAPGNARGLDMR